MTYSSEVLADSPYAYWRLGEASGVFFDSATVKHGGKSVEAGLTRVSGLLTGDSDGAVNTTSGAAAFYPSAFAGSSQFDYTESVAALFDGSTSTRWTTSSGSTGWVTWSTTATVAPASYSITAYAPATGRAPKTWTLYGSNDGVTWTAADSRTTETGWSSSARTYAIAGSTAYRYWKLDITANNGDGLLSMSEISMAGATIATSPMFGPTLTRIAWDTLINITSDTIAQVFDFGGTLRMTYVNSKQIEVQVRDSAGATVTAAVTCPAFSVGTKAHVACVINGTSYSVYLNGTLVGTTTLSTNGTIKLSTTNDAWVGVRQGGSFRFPGVIDELAFYDTLSSTRIAAHAAAVSGSAPVTTATGTSPVSVGSSSAATLVATTTGTSPVSVGSSSAPTLIATATGTSPVAVGSSSAASIVVPITTATGTSPVAVGSSSSATTITAPAVTTGTSPVSVGSSVRSYLVGASDALSGGFSFGSSLTSGAITVADQTLSGGFSFGSTLASIVVAVQQLEGGFSFGGRLTQQRDWGIPAGYTRPTPSVVIAHRDGTPVTNLPEVNIGELTSAVGALDSWQFSVDRDNAEGKKVDPVALEAHLYRGSVLMSKGPIGPGRLNDGRMVYDCSDPRWYLWDGRRIDRRPRLNWVYNGDFRLGTAGWTGGYEPGSIPEAVPVFSVVDEPESTSGKGLKIGGVDKVVTSVTDVETAAVFVPNSSAYLSGGEAILISAANSIPDGSNINIVGHTADRRAYGDPGNGLALSLARAQAARSTLHAHNSTWTFSLLPGLLSPNMNDGVVAGRGYYEQVASNSTEPSSAKNRRVALHYSSTQTASGHKQFVYQRKLGVVNTSKVELPVIISGRMTIGEWLGAPANNYALWAQVYDSSGKAIGAASGSVEPATATMYEQTPREAFRDYDVTVNIPPTNGQTYWIEYRLFPPAGWAVWTDIEVTPDEQLEFFGVDQALIIRDLVAFAQNPSFGHGPLGITSRTPLTGVTRTKEYPFREHKPVGTAVEELTSLAHGPEVDCEMTANTATIVTHYPRQGTIASFSLAHGGPRSIVKAYQPLPANTRTLASSVVVQAWGISNNRYERFIKDDAALGGTLLETVIDADAATPVNELAEVARQSLARSIHPLAAWEVTLDPARTSEVLDEIGKGDVVMLSLPDENVHALHRVVTIVWDPETDTLTLQLAPEEA